MTQSNVVEVDPTEPGVAHLLAELLRRSYAVEAELIGFRGIPGLTATAETVASGGLRWLVRLDGGRIVAALGVALDRDVLDLDSLVVDPTVFRQGHGRAIVEHALRWPGVQHWVVGTAAGNGPAVRLYERLGFVEVERTDAGEVVYVRFRLERDEPSSPEVVP